MAMDLTKRLDHGHEPDEWGNACIRVAVDGSGSLWYRVVSTGDMSGPTTRRLEDWRADDFTADPAPPRPTDALLCKVVDSITDSTGMGHAWHWFIQKPGAPQPLVCGWSPSKEIAEADLEAARTVWDQRLDPVPVCRICHGACDIEHERGAECVDCDNCAPSSRRLADA